MKNKIFLFLPFLLVFILSCSSEGENNKMESSYDMATYEEAAEPVSELSNETSNSTVKVTERKIIKEGNISFEVKNVKETRDRINKVIEEVEGYVSNDNEYKYSDRIEQSITIRVPSKNFNALLNKITEGVERLDSRNISATDVTEEYVDVLSRIKTKKELEARYKEIMQKAYSVSDMLEIERQMGILREEIESAEGRLKYLENRVSLSTLTVSFYEYHETKHGFGSEFGRGFVNGWTNMVWFLVGLVNIWPFVVLVIVLTWLIIRKYKKRKAQKNE